MKATHPFLVLTVGGGLLIGAAWWWGHKDQEIEVPTPPTTIAAASTNARPSNRNDPPTPARDDVATAQLSAASEPQTVHSQPIIPPENLRPGEEPWITEAKGIVANRLKDPDSAQFRSLKSISSDQVCGQVNAKNALGGYVGYRWFWIKGPDDQKPAVVIDGNDALAELICDPDSAPIQL